MLDPLVIAAFVTIVAWLIGLGTTALGIPLAPEILNALAGAIVAYLLAQLGLGIAKRTIFKALVKRGILAPEK
jgi:hypothetical protein